jgi:hypothetical protein
MLLRPVSMGDATVRATVGSSRPSVGSHANVAGRVASKGRGRPGRVILSTL